MWLFAFVFAGFPVIGPWALREKNSLEFASQSALYRLQTQAM